jgi:hypothetical protein
MNVELWAVRPIPYWVQVEPRDHEALKATWRSINYYQNNTYGHLRFYFSFPSPRSHIFSILSLQPTSFFYAFSAAFLKEGHFSGILIPASLLRGSLPAAGFQSPCLF